METTLAFMDTTMNLLRQLYSLYTKMQKHANVGEINDKTIISCEDMRNLI